MKITKRQLKIMIKEELGSNIEVGDKLVGDILKESTMISLNPITNMSKPSETLESKWAKLSGIPEEYINIKEEYDAYSINSVRERGQANEMADEVHDIMSSMGPGALSGKEAYDMIWDALGHEDPADAWYDLLSSDGRLGDAITGLKQTADEDFNPDIPMEENTKISKQELKRIIREERNTALLERGTGNPALRVEERAMIDAIIGFSDAYMLTMGMNPGDQADAERVRRTIDDMLDSVMGGILG
jgi:hypothetical protein